MIALLALLGTASAGEIDLRVLSRGDAAPVAEAEVLLDGEPIALDERGRATFEAPDGVEATLVITSFDHDGATVAFTPPLDKPLRVFLAPTPETGEIVVEAFRPRSDLTRHHVDAEMAYETPGTYDDAVRLVQALPGVNVQREYAPSSGDISVRGSQPGDNRYYLDGIEVPYLYHFNQYASVFPASQLDSLDLYSSGYGARYGDSVGAIIEAESDTTRPRGITGHASLNLVTVGADIQVPLPDKWWIGGGFRRSFHDILGDTSQQYPIWPVFYDFQVRAEQGDEQRGFGVFSMGAGDRYERAVGELDVKDPLEAEGSPTLDYRRDYQLLGFRHRWRRGRVVTAFLHDHLKADISAGGRQDQRTMSLPTRVDARGPIVEHLTWEAGAEFRPEVLLADVQDGGVFGSLVTTEAPATAWGADLEATRFRARVHAYGELQAQLGPVRLMPGVRVGIDTEGWEPTLEPRLAARFRVAEQTELRLGGGRYQQRPDTLQLQLDPDLPTTSAWEVMGGIDQTLGGRVEIIAEGYGRFLKNPLFQPVDGPPRAVSRGQSYGAELTIRYRLRETFFLWAWGAWGRAFLFEDPSDGPGEDTVRFSSGSDQPWSGGVVASWNILPPLNVALRYRIASGLPFTQIEGSVYDAIADTWDPRYAPPNGERMPLYQKLDFHIAYTFVFNRWSLALSADVWYVPKPSAQLYPTWNYDFTRQGYVLGPQVLPLVGLRASF